MGEWVQVRHGPPNTMGLKRGHWYRVESRRNDGMIRVMGEGAIVAPIHEGLVRVASSQPDFVTRILVTGLQPIEPGQPFPMMEYAGVCPLGHEISRLSVADAEVRCLECRREYSIEDEAHT